MPEIKIKHVVSFSSEHNVHKAENLLNPETYRKWTCATPGEKSATVLLQFEKACKISKIDIGNECSAFVEVLVGRSSDPVNNYKVLLVASSFMSPLESRCESHTNRVRIFGPDKLAQNVKDEKWDCAQVVCTQPFNKNITYGLTFIKFHSPSEKKEEQPNTAIEDKPETRLGAFKLKDDEEEDEDSSPSLGSWFAKRKAENSSGSTADKAAPSYAVAVLASNGSATKNPSQDSSLKRKVENKNDVSQEPPAKKTSLNKEHIIYKDVLRGAPENKRPPESPKVAKKDTSTSEKRALRKETASPSTSNKQGANNTPANSSKRKVPFNKIMDRVVFVLSGFLNPLRSELREKAIEMGAKYKPDWDTSCTHLVCAFINTPKFEQVKKLNGRIVTKEWILDCYKKKEPLLWRKYELSDDTDDDVDDSKDTKNNLDDSDDTDKDANYSAEDDEEESDEYELENNDEEESDEYEIENDDEEDYVDKKKKRSRKKNTEKKALLSPSKKKQQSPMTQNQSNASTPKRKKNISGSEDESIISSKKKVDSSVFNRLKEQQQNDISDNSQSSSAVSPSKKKQQSPKTQNQSNAGTPKRKINISDSEDESIISSNKKADSSISNRLKEQQQNDISDDSQSSVPTVKCGSETEDEDALQDYVADTDVEDDSGGDTEDEIRKAEQKIAKKKAKMNGTKKDAEISEKPDVTDLPLPELPNFFKKKRFFLYGEFSSSKLHDLQRYITAYNGILEEYMGENVKYVITEKKWDSNFENALNENEDLIFVKPAWIYKCHEAGKNVPYQPYIVIPET